MTERSRPIRTDKAIKVRRRMADMRWAAQMRGRGWTCTPPADEIQKMAEARQ